MAKAETPAKPKPAKDEKRSIVKNRGLMFRVLAYLLPFKRYIIGSLVIAFISGFVGAFSILTMVPVLQMVIDPKEAEQQAEQFQESRKEKDIELGFDKPKNTGMSQIDNGVKIVDDFAKDHPKFDHFIKLLSRYKERARESLMEYLTDDRENAVRTVALVLFGLTIIKAYMEFKSKYLMSKAFYSAIQNLKVELYTGCLGLDMASLQDRTSANMMSRLGQDMIKIRNVMQGSLAQSVKVPFEIIWVFVALLVINPKITLVTFVAVPLVVIPVGLLGKKLRNMGREDAEEDSSLMDVMQETLQGMEIVKAFGAEGHEQERFDRVSKAQLKKQVRRLRLREAAPVVVEVLTMGAMCIVIVLGAYLVMKTKELKLSEFIVYIVLLTRFYKPFKGVSSGFVKVQTGLAAAERIFEIMDTTPKVVEKPNAIALGPFDGEIVFNQVSFTYNKQRNNALTAFSVTIPKGTTCALVGQTGSGKTTVARLLPRFWDPTEGHIAIDGHDLRDVTMKSIRDQISMVTQETILFDSSIYYNISYGKPSASRVEVEAAAKAANIHDFILSLPQGYETPIGEKGGRLSGGQRQRLAIARAILRNAPILILDEATSALDNETEALIQQALDRLMENRTVLVIAHRLSTVRNADKILVLHDGKVIEEGSHEVLYSAGGRYRALYESHELSAGGVTQILEEEGPGVPGESNVSPLPVL